MSQQIQFRRGTAAAWTSADTILASGELGFETNTGQFKIGDGATTWSALDYAVDAGGATTLDGLTDVVITAAASGDILRHNGTNWVDAVGTTHFEVAGAAATSTSAAAAALAAHEADTTSIHGITNTASLYAAGGTDVAVTDGGTGGSTASAARTNLGLVIGTDVAAATASSTTVSGIVELATSAETTTGTDTVRAVTPAGGAAAYALSPEIRFIKQMTAAAYAALGVKDSTTLYVIVG